MFRCLVFGGYIISIEIVVHFVAYFGGNLFLVEYFKNGNRLFFLDLEKFTVDIQAVRLECSMKSFFQFGTVARLYFTSIFNIKRHGYAGRIEFFEASIKLMAGGHANFHEARHCSV